MLPTSWIQLNLLLPAFCLVLGRVSGIMITAPLLGSVAIPMLIKVSLVLVVSMMMFPMLAPALPDIPNWSVVLSGLAGELMIGLILGMGLNIILLATQMTGMIIGQQAGLSLANLFDPTTELQTSVIGEIYFFTATTLFLLMGGHRAMVGALLDTFQSIPVLSFQAGASHVDLLVRLMMNSLELALKTAAPALLALFLTKACLGFLSRTIPQLHILSVGFGILTLVGILMCGLGAGSLFEVMAPDLQEALGLIRAALGMDS